MLRDVAGPLTDAYKQLIIVLEVAGLEALVPRRAGGPGRPLDDRHALARAFAAKAVLGLAETSMLIERLAVGKTLRRLCGWHRLGQVPSEATYSRAFAELADSGSASGSAVNVYGWSQGLPILATRDCRLSCPEAAEVQGPARLIGNGRKWPRHSSH